MRNKFKIEAFKPSALKKSRVALADKYNEYFLEDNLRYQASRFKKKTLLKRMRNIFFVEKKDS